MQHTDKMYQESGLGGGHFFALCTAGSLELPETSLPWTHWRGGVTAPPRQAAALGNDIRSLHIVPSEKYHFHPTNLAYHSKFLLQRPSVRGVDLKTKSTYLHFNKSRN